MDQSLYGSYVLYIVLLLLKVECVVQGDGPKLVWSYLVYIVLLLLKVERVVQGDGPKLVRELCCIHCFIVVKS